MMRIAFVVTLSVLLGSGTCSSRDPEIGNVALRKHCLTTSISGGGLSSYAVDGSLETCYKSKIGARDPLWRVDLRETFTVDRIVITPDPSTNLEGLEVRIGYSKSFRDPRSNPLCHTIHNSTSSEYEVRCGERVTAGRYVTFQIPGYDKTMGLCEVQVYGYQFKPEDACYYGVGRDYRGSVGVTKSGKRCQAWSSQSPHGHKFKPHRYESSGLESNYCRNPDGSHQPWCYTVDPDTRWETCFEGPTCHNDWREDLRCGPEFRLSSGRPAQCNPDHDWHCCSWIGWCGNTTEHCHCDTCHNYDGKNLALGKTAIQSTTDHDGPAPLAIDGTEGRDYFASRSCSHTYDNNVGTTNPWWRVDLYNENRIGLVVVFNREDCCGDRLDGFEVRVGNSREKRWDANPRCEGRQAVVEGKLVYAVDCGGHSGRYVTVTIPGEGKILTLCEVEVYAPVRSVGPCDHHNCHEKAECIPGQGASFTCVCIGGLVGDGVTTCEPMDPCESEPCHAEATCGAVDTEKGYACTCNPGFEGDGEEVCVKKDACDSEPCHSEATCYQSDNSAGYLCVCNEGFEEHATEGCARIDHCHTSPCHSLATCFQVDVEPWFVCLCADGHRGDGVESCEKIDPCEANPCGSDIAICSATEDGFTCTCPEGFQGDGSSCEKINPCEAEPCHRLADCQVTSGAPGYSCKCKPGWTGNGVTSCEDVNECAAQETLCHESATCTNTPGSYQCTCKDGFSGDGLRCENRNECLDGTHNCLPDVARCIDTIGSFNCECLTGFEGDGVKSCTKIDPCEANPCGPDIAICSATEEGFTCTCPEGFQGDGSSCEKINPCEAEPCHRLADCQVTPEVPGYTCQCKPGFTGNGVSSCEDVNECEKEDLCHINATCTNTPGSYECACNQGYMGDGKRCENRNECEDGTHNCLKDVATCFDTIGSFECECLTGFEGDGVEKCVDVNECKEYEGICDYPNSVCVNTKGGAKCVCEDGFEGDVRQCQREFDYDATVFAVNPLLKAKLGGMSRFHVRIRNTNFRLTYAMIQWRKLPNTNLSPPPVPWIKTPNNRRSLVISSILPEDTGKYQVRIDGVENATATVELQLLDPIVCEEPHLTVKVGETATFRTMFNIWPMPGYRMVSWRKGEKSLSPPPKGRKYGTPMNRKHLIIRDVQEEDAGVYTVTVRADIRDQTIVESYDVELTVVQ